MSDELKPGIYPDVDFNTYASWDAANHSRLSGFKNTPLHGHDRFVYEREPTEATEFGWLVHVALLEPARLWKEACVRPAGDARTKEVKPLWEAFKKSLEKGGENEGKKVLTAEKAADLDGIVKSVMSHPTAREYLTGRGQNEVSIVWRDKETSELCKARLDRVALASRMPGVPEHEDAHPAKPLVLILDIKTHHEPLSQRSVEKSIYNYDYASAAAMYLEGFNAVMPSDEPRPFVWVFAEKERPYGVRLFTPSADMLDYGYQRWHGWLRQYAECKRSGNWPGWGAGIEEAYLPAWVGKVMELGL